MTDTKHRNRLDHDQGVVSDRAKQIRVRNLLSSLKLVPVIQLCLIVLESVIQVSSLATNHCNIYAP